MLAPAAMPIITHHGGLNLVAEARKAQEERVRQEFKAILQVQHEQIISKRLATSGLADNSFPSAEEALLPPPPPESPESRPTQEAMSLVCQPKVLPNIPGAHDDASTNPAPSAQFMSVADEPEHAQPLVAMEAAYIAPEQNPLAPPCSPGG